MNSSVGEILREARENQGRAIAEVAEELCLTQRYLRAIEDNEVDGLPGIFFYRSFVKQYAKYLGVDQTRVQLGLDAMLSHLEPAPEAGGSAGDPVVESTNRYYVPNRAIGWPLAAMLGVLLFCTGFYAWWSHMIPSRSAKPAASVASVLLTPSLSRPSSSPASTPDASTTNSAGRIGDASASSVPVSLTQGGQVQLPGEAKLTVSTTQAGGESKVLLTVSAIQETWISVTSGGKEIYSGLLKPKESTTVAGTDIATMVIGNAGGVAVQLNGKAIPQLGTSGQVLTVRFTPQEFHIMPQTGEPL